MKHKWSNCILIEIGSLNAFPSVFYSFVKAKKTPQHASLLLGFACFVKSNWPQIFSKDFLVCLFCRNQCFELNFSFLVKDMAFCITLSNPHQKDQIIMKDDESLNIPLCKATRKFIVSIFFEFLKKFDDPKNIKSD